MANFLEYTPYILDDLAGRQVEERLQKIEERVALLRKQGLTKDTVLDYYGEKRFEQVAESNAIEGSTLSVGETEMAVLKGVTITGHDPAFIRDARALNIALQRIAELAKEHTATDIAQLQEVHSLLLGERRGAGLFRQEAVRISGSSHTPPQTWNEVMGQMENWQTWSRTHAELPAPIRCIVLQSWLTHIHPYIDGNGRTSRAIGNLELIRAGYPPIIIRKKERDLYITALAESDQGGDIRQFVKLVFDRLEGALIGLENSAKRKQGFNPIAEKLREQQERQLKIWDQAVRLLASIVEHDLTEAITPIGGRCELKTFESTMDLDDYVQVCLRHSILQSWAFIISLFIPGHSPVQRLAFVGHRTPAMYNRLGQEGGPSLYWSRPNPTGLHKWIGDDEVAPLFAVELTIRNGQGDEWHVRHINNEIKKLHTTELAHQIVKAICQAV